MRCWHVPTASWCTSWRPYFCLSKGFEVERGYHCQTLWCLWNVAGTRRARSVSCKLCPSGKKTACLWTSQEKKQSDVHVSQLCVPREVSARKAGISANVHMFWILSSASWDRHHLSVLCWYISCSAPCLDILAETNWKMRSLKISAKMRISLHIRALCLRLGQLHFAYLGSIWNFNQMLP